MEFVVFIGVIALLVLAEHAASRVRWGRFRPLSDEGRRRPTAEPTRASVVHPAVGVGGEREESLLVAWLLAGEIPPAAYRRVMADLARQDALRHPVVIPPDHRP